jgi:ketohexokinase
LNSEGVAVAQILLVGVATLDIVYQLEQYPREDDEVRAKSLRVCRGGNASNTAVVLAQLGHRSCFCGVLADVPEVAVIEQDLIRHSVDFSSCVRVPGRLPTSSIYLTGVGRTIVHYRDLPELSAEQFAMVDLSQFEWIHFEGRNVPELLKMLQRVKVERPELPVSIELEKVREGMEAVHGLADLLICSRGYAQSCGYTHPQSFLDWLRNQAQQADLVVAWGEAGAYGLTRYGEIVHSPAFPPERVMDTLGAGDTFNAGLIGNLARGEGLTKALRAACQLAGKKCGVYGLNLLDRQLNTPL